MVALRSQGNWRWEGPLGTPLGLVPGSPAGSTAHEYSACGEVFGVWTLSIHPAGGGLSLYRGAVTEGQVAGTWPSLDVLS